MKLGEIRQFGDEKYVAVSVNEVTCKGCALSKLHPKYCNSIGEVCETVSGENIIWVAYKPVSERTMHERFYRKVWVFKTELVGSLAKWLVKQSPYVVPDNLSKCLESFHSKLDLLCVWNSVGMAELELSTLVHKYLQILETIPEIMALNETKNANTPEILFTCAFCVEPNPDDDFIAILAVAQNMVCDLADREDTDCWLEQSRGIK